MRLCGWSAKTALWEAPPGAASSLPLDFRDPI